MIGIHGCKRVYKEGQVYLSGSVTRRSGRPRPLSAAVCWSMGVVDLTGWLKCFECERLCDGAGVEERLEEGEDLCVARELLLARLPEELEMSASGV